MTISLDFASDNWAGVSPLVMEAVAQANGGLAPAYGGDEISRRVEARFSDLFERDVAVIPVPTGTAANGLALDALARRDGLIVGHEEAHIFTKEAGARAFFNDHARLIKMHGLDGKLSPQAVDDLLGGLSPADRSPVRRHAALSLTQGGDCGTVYAADEVAALSHAAKKHDVHVHMDGARFANAVASLGCAPADITWRAGVDILSFGATKNGGLGADAVVIFDPAGAGAEWLHRAREACDWFGYLASKSRFVAAQFDAMLADGHWLDLARRANAMAERLAVGLEAVPGVRLAFPRQINEVFAVLPQAVDATMRAKGARYHPWTTKSSAPDRAPRDGEGLFRFVASFETNAENVDALLAAASSATSAEAAE
ncbi:MAG: hypothetical protein BGP06_13255 [Rhizobiales bacterium 65-9]|nr:low specificity L-threonine aldolase [Hyphomicrobiales bacterium]OJY34086.1 MAG: hypothetical protein BGP06_13255 [Rhizobiales bacterium 65-9]